MDMDRAKKIGLFAGGVLFGTAGVRLLASEDAKSFYIKCLAAVLRAKDCVMTTATSIQEGAKDILAEAQAINEMRYEEEVFEDEGAAAAEDGAEAEKAE